ncbi:DUF2059 domain-containing protein [Noviherbaspirillum galbum]|uniref:DUF2059 domain-containing protein n=1 Tax=Noviherbaspirillum galbum TaxID=2709383 RepID=A0A6B3SYU8_9BURK|nr:DUF2059 domain-containing protein [Noviherbaspirillum galbum]NEX64052.1 DUF2059 domain-containing protein [Noviherbaspirillum galbum]
MLRPVIAAIALTVAGAALADAPQSKQDLVNRVMELWRMDAVGQAMLQEPVAEAVQQARAVLQGRAPADRRDAAMRDIAEDAKRFLQETTPIVTKSTEKLGPATLSPLLAERFSEDELRQIIAILESPVKTKFEALVPEMRKSLGEKVAADTREAIDPKLKDLTQRIGVRLRTAVMP